MIIRPYESWRLAICAGGIRASLTFGGGISGSMFGLGTGH